MGTRISQFTPLTTVASADYFPLVQASDTTNKRVSLASLLASVPLGSAATPSIAFTGDTNTGIFSPGADQVAISTSGSEKLIVLSDGKVGIGTSAPNYQLHATTSFAVGASGFNQQLSFTNDTIQSLLLGTGYTSLKLNPLGGNVGIGTTSPGGTLDIKAAASTHPLIVQGPSSEFARIDSSGRLLVGTSTSASAGGNAQYARIQVFGNTYDDSYGILNLGRKEASTSITSGEYLGAISFSDQSGNEYANIIATADAAAGTNDYPGRLVFSTTADGASSPTERIRIKSDGVTSFGQGATGPGSGVAGTLINAGDGGILITNDTAPFLRCYTLNGGFPNALQIANNGNVTNANNSYGAISDIKLKENIVDANSQWSDIKALQVRNYNFKEGQTHTQIGLIAQEVELVSPGLVSESPDRDEDGNDLGTVTKSVNYSVLYMKAVKALQEAMERIETLETKVAALEA